MRNRIKTNPSPANTGLLRLPGCSLGVRVALDMLLAPATTLRRSKCSPAALAFPETSGTCSDGAWPRAQPQLLNCTDPASSEVLCPAVNLSKWGQSAIFHVHCGDKDLLTVTPQ